MPPPPPPLLRRVFLRFFQKHWFLTHAARRSCSFIFETHYGIVWRQMVAMVTR